MTLNDFLERLGSSDPTPGGGALAAVAGAMASAMLAMVCNLTLGRDRYADVEAEVCDILAQCVERQQGMMRLANEDAASYLAVRDAYRLPRASDDERMTRLAAIQAALQGATEVPLATTRAARGVLALAARCAEITNVSVLGDVAVAAHLGLGAARGAAQQARLNLLSLTDSEFIARITGETEDVLAGAEADAARSLHAVDARAAG
jgi:formiminotetrahydrofolate cyclodeaminase